MEEVSIEKLGVFYDLLNQDQRELVFKTSRTIHFKKNQIIYKEGETSTGLYFITSGKVKIYKEGVGGRNQIVRLIRTNYFFGYRALFAKEPFITSSLAIENCTLIFVPKETLFECLKTNNNVALYFIKTLAIDLGQSNQQTVSLTQKHIRGRLAEALIFLKNTYGIEEDGATLNIYMSREDLANLSNMTTSNAIRTLSNFSQEKIIAVDGRKVKIIDEDQLIRISKLG